MRVFFGPGFILLMWMLVALAVGYWILAVAGVVLSIFFWACKEYWGIDFAQRFHERMNSDRPKV